MKTITIRLAGTDGAPHGHGYWSLDEESLEVTDEQYEEIAGYFEDGDCSTHLEDMFIEGLDEKCNRMIQDQLDMAELGGFYMRDYCAWIEVLALEEE